MNRLHLLDRMIGADWPDLSTPAAVRASAPKRAASAAPFTGAKRAQVGSSSSRGSSTQYCTHGVSSTSKGGGQYRVPERHTGVPRTVTVSQVCPSWRWRRNKNC
jgi:hypothetical protein